MRNLKQTLAVVIALTMVLGTVVFAGFSDVQGGSAYEEAIEVGVALNLYQGYEDGTFKPEGAITRAEFAAIVVRALNQEGQAEGAKTVTKFADVPSTHWAAGYVNIAANQGIILGYGDGNFGPEDEVTYEQAVKMLVVALGYEPAVGSAGYPVGYLTIANQRGITAGVNGKNGVAANRGQVAQLVFNSLDVPLMEQSGFGNFIEYIVQDGTGNDSPYKKSLLSESFSVAKLRVNVLQNLAIDNVRKADMVKIRVDRDYKSKFANEDYYGDVVFDTKSSTSTTDVVVGNSGIQSLVGTRAIAYIQVDEYGDNDPLVLYAARYIANTDTVDFTSDDLEGNPVAKPSLADVEYFEIEYYETPSATRTSKLTLAADANVYVNGHLTTPKMSPAAIVGNFAGFYGTISFSDEGENTSKAEFDTVFINDYKTMIVEEVNMSAMRVTGEGSIPSISFDSKDTGVISKLIDKDGKELEWSSLKENDVLSVQRVEGSVVSTIATLITDTVTGTVDEEDSSGNETEYKIGGTSYKINDIFTDGVELGNEGIFYLDIMGRIVKFDLEDTTARNYAYVIGADAAGTAFDNAAEIRFFTAKGEIATFQTASKVTVEKVVNGEYKSVSSITGTDLGTKGNDNYIKTGDIVVFTLNSSGRISKITYPRPNTAQTGFREYADGTTGAYNYRSESFTVGGKRVYINNSTVIMKVGVVDPDNFDHSDDDFELVSLAAASDDIDLPALTGNPTRIYAFDVNKSNVANVIVIVGEFDITSSENGIAMLKSSAIGSTTAGDRVAKATVFQNGIKNDYKEVELVGSPDFGEDLVTKNAGVLKQGDLFTTSLNASGQIKTNGLVKVATIVDVKEGDKVVGNKAELVASGASADDKVDYAMYKVTNRSGARVDVKDEATNVEDVIVIPSKANVYVYNQFASTTNNRVIAPLDRYNVFYALKEGDEVNLYNDINKAEADIQMFVRYYEGEVVDVVLYMWRK